MRTHKDINMHMLKCRHANTHWLMPVPLCILYQTHTVSMAWGPSPWNITALILTSLLWWLRPTTRMFETLSQHAITLLSLTQNAPFLNTLQYSMAEIPQYNIGQLSVKCCVSIQYSLMIMHTLKLVSWINASAQIGLSNCYGALLGCHSHTVLSHEADIQGKEMHRFGWNLLLEASWRVEVSWG